MSIPIPLSIALAHYKKNKVAPLRDYIATQEKLSTEQTRRILLYINESKREIEQDLVVDIVEKGNKVFSILSAYHTMRIREGFLSFPLDKYMKIREGIIANENILWSTNTTSLKLESFSEIYQESDPVMVLINLACITTPDPTFEKNEDFKINSAQYLNVLENFEFSLKNKDCPVLEKKLKKLCKQKNLNEHKCAIENIIKLADFEKVEELIEQNYDVGMSVPEFLTQFKTITQSYIEKNNLQLALDIPSKQPNVVKTLIKI